MKCSFRQADSSMRKINVGDYFRKLKSSTEKIKKKSSKKSTLNCHKRLNSWEIRKIKVSKCLTWMEKQLGKLGKINIWTLTTMRLCLKEEYIILGSKSLKVQTRRYTVGSVDKQSKHRMNHIRAIFTWPII